MSQIDAPTLLGVMRRIEKRGSLETAKRVRQRVSAVFVYAIAKGSAATDPAAIISGALAPIVRKKRQPALVSVADLVSLLNSTEALRPAPILLLASRMLAFSAVRPGVLREARWEEFSDQFWTIPSERMKLLRKFKGDSDRDFLVPITAPMREILTAIESVFGKRKFVFETPGDSSRNIREGAIGSMYNDAGWRGRHVPHGWRASFSTIMNERRPGDRAIIDLMLAHVPHNRVEAAYNRSTYLAQRIEIAAEWSDLLASGIKPVREILLQLPSS
jgi:integrase